MTKKYTSSIETQQIWVEAQEFAFIALTAGSYAGGQKIKHTM